MTLAVAKLWISETRRVGGVFKGLSHFTQVRRGVRVVQDGVDAFGMVGELACPCALRLLLP